MTRYLVLRNGPADSWKSEATVEARTAEEAIRRAITPAKTDPDTLTAHEPHGTFVAVPARSWKPVKVQTETKTRITFS